MADQEENSMFGISRIDQNRKDGRNQHCWWVRLFNKGRKPQIQKTFPDRKCGGREKALSAAIEFRDEQLERFGEFFKHSEKLLWKDRTVKVRRNLQAEYKNGKKEKIYFGIGSEAAKKAYDMGFCRVICNFIRTGRQDSVVINHGGWWTPRYELFEFKREVSQEQTDLIRSLVECYASGFSDVEKTEMVNEVIIRFVTDNNVMDLKNIKRMIWFLIKVYPLRKKQRESKFVPLDAYDGEDSWENQKVALEVWGELHGEEDEEETYKDSEYFDDGYFE